MNTQPTARRYGNSKRVTLDRQRPTPDSESHKCEGEVPMDGLHNNEREDPLDGLYKCEGGAPMDGLHTTRSCPEGNQIRSKLSWFFGPTAEPMRRVLYGVQDVYQHAATLWRAGYTKPLASNDLHSEEYLHSEWVTISYCAICGKRRAFDILNDSVCDKCYNHINSVFYGDYFVKKMFFPDEETSAANRQAVLDAKEAHRRKYAKRQIKGCRRSMSYELSKRSKGAKPLKMKMQSGTTAGIWWLSDLLSLCVGYAICGHTALLAFLPRIYSFISQYWRFIRLVPLVVNHTDLVAREITLLVSLKTCITSARDNHGVAAAIVMYLQAHSQRSLFGHVIDTFRGLLGNSQKRADEENIYATYREMVEQSGETETDWLDSIRKCLSNWHQYIDSPQARNCKKLISYIVSAGMCDASNLTFTLGGYKIFEPRVIEATIGPLELLDVVASCVIEFVEGGYAAFQSRNPKAFFMLDTTTREFELKYDKVRDLHGYAITGNLGEYTSMTDNDYEQLLDTTIASGDAIVNRSKRMTPERKFIMDRLERMRAWRTEFNQMRTRGGFRLAPFAISLYGNTGLGKSSLNKLTYEAIGTYNGFDVSEDRVAIWADNDKYASNIRSSTNVIIFDDFGNTSPQFTDTSPVYRLIQTINNALFLAPMADVAMKGKVALRPWLVTVTTNKRYLLAETYSQKPESVLRRLYHINVDVMDEYKTGGRLDSKKVSAAFGFEKCPDIWKISIYYCYVGPELANNADKNHYELRLLHFEGVEMYNVSVRQYLRWAQLASKEHYEFQKQMVATMTNGKPVDICTQCGMCYCHCPPLEEDASVCTNTSKSRCTVTSIPLEVETVLDACAEQEEDEFVNPVSDDEPIDYMDRKALARMITWSCQKCKKAPCKCYQPHIGHSDVVDTARAFAASTARQVGNSSIVRQLLLYVQRMNRERLDQLGIEMLVERDILFDSRLVDFVPLVCPYWVIDSALASYLQNFLRLVVFKSQFSFYACQFSCLYVLSGVYAFFGIVGVLFVLSSILLSGIWLAYFERERIRNDLLLRRNATYDAYVRVARSRAAACFAGSLVGYCVYRMCRNYFKWREVLTPQGNLCPTGGKDIVERTSETNPWSQLVLTTPVMSVESKTTIGKDLAEVVARNTVYLETGKQFTRGFFVRSNVLVLPWHFCEKCWEQGEFVAKVFRAPLNTTTPNFRVTISETYAVRIPDVDFALVWCPSGGLFKDLSQYLIRDGTCTGEALFLLKHKDGSHDVFPTKCVFPGEKVSHTKCSNMTGVHYELPFVTKPGMCMSPVISAGKGSCLLGFHLCGSDRLGGAASLFASSYRSAERLLSEIPGVNISLSAVPLPETHMGSKLIESLDVSPKCATRFVSPDATLEVYGATSGASTQYSNVVRTVISPLVTEVMGVECKWGKPPKKLPDGTKLYPYQVGLDVLAHPSLSMGTELATAVESYLHTVLLNSVLMNECKKMTPLDLFTTINGRQGDKFLDGMKLSTSAGWPFTKSKRFFTRKDPTVDLPEAVTFNDDIMVEVEVARKKLLEGCRIYAVWRACLKDEPTKLSATKVRIFQCAPLVLQILLRQYFLPISRLMQLFPLEFECMVGINAESPEWEQMYEYMISKSKENIFAGDYGKYDLRMPAQLVLAAFDVLIRLASHAGYTENDLVIMRGLACEVAYPLMAFNGTLVQLFGSNPSGQNMTVVINSVVNSLLARSCFYTIYPSASLSEFRQYVAIGTYGDDVMGSVHDAKKEFNIVSFSNFVGSYDIVFTMPNKEDELIPFMSLTDADFLKRRNFYNPDLECNIGVLSDASIFKRLHCTMESSYLSNRELSALALETSLRDWFYAGREIFDKRQRELMEIAEKAQLLHLCPELKDNYDKRVTKWREKYLDASTPNSIGVD